MEEKRILTVKEEYDHYIVMVNGVAVASKEQIGEYVTPWGTGDEFAMGVVVKYNLENTNFPYSPTLKEAEELIESFLLYASRGGSQSDKERAIRIWDPDAHKRSYLFGGIEKRVRSKTRK